LASYGFGSSVTLYAQWTANSFTVTFDANGGSGSMAAQSSSVAAALTPNSFTRSGFTFAGWNTAANGSGTSYANLASYGFGSSVTLYAQWTAVSQVVNNQVQQVQPSPPSQSEEPFPVIHGILACVVTEAQICQVTLTGTNLDRHSAVISSSGTVQVVEATSALLRVRVLAPQLGHGWLTLVNPTRSTRVVDSVKIVTQAFEDQIVEQKSLDLRVNFAGNSSTISNAEKRRILSALAALPSKSEVVITGSAASNSWTGSARQIALARAKAVAALVRQVATDAVVRIELAPKVSNSAAGRSATLKATWGGR
jgi:uncharacterized repeat protein (TIGR02543 family)